MNALPIRTQTRTERTEDEYEHRLTQFLHSVNEHLGNPIGSSVSPTEVADYFQLKSNEWLPSTLRFNRAFIMRWMDALLLQQPESETLKQAISTIRETRAKKNRKTDQKSTSSYKAKSIPQDHLKAMIDHCKTLRSEWATKAINYLQGNILTGLRPCEWETALWVDTTTLIIRNAKATNGRANGPTRMVTISAEDPLYEATKQHFLDLQAWRAAGGEFDKYYENARKAIQRINRSLWPTRTKRHYTLYTGRHQFAANEKAGGASKAKIAENMGHASDETAAKHYGKGRSGWNKKPSPMPESKPDMEIGK